MTDESVSGAYCARFATCHRVSMVVIVRPDSGAQVCYGKEILSCAKAHPESPKINREMSRQTSLIARLRSDRTIGRLQTSP